ncbi:hypothetical protein A9P82_08245 [Arachidicoccus ginsenosidimutans]|uniref:DsrE family protein n=1 Tax=Arachidicoccus sp. BS20 TaxID=1850526 RepID=UPI0007F0F983|nr:DsrE family protein [Arachidicoccus sp. BS20]ANI89280.1 hypothetical protein A9P82_08245 [Arachidicoccus sp. BS20]
MKKVSLFVLAILLGTAVLHAQSLPKALQQNRDFAGAKATLSMYHAIYQIDVSDSNVIKKTLRNINNALNDPRLKGKVQIELIAFADGVTAYLKTSPYEQALKDLVMKGVIVAQCANTLKEKHISRDKIYDFVGVVPSGNGELIIRQAEGWSIVKP